jgi:hypothetical protein
LLHLGLLLLAARAAVSPGGAFLTLVVPTAYGWLLGYIKERTGNGSLLPLW